MKRSRTSKFLPAVALLLGAGCAVGPRYTPPKPAMPAEFSEAKKPATGAATHEIAPGPEAIARWWLVFNDAELNSLIERAAQKNFDVQQALSRVRMARAQRAAAASGLFPQINASASYDRAHGSENVDLPFGGGGAGGGASATTASAAGAEPRATARSTEQSGAASAGGGTGPPASPLGQGGLPGLTTNLYQAGFDAAWELDVFGGTRRAIEAADAGVAAAEEAGRGVLVTLCAEVAMTYVELRSTQQRLHLARDHRANQRAELDLVEAKFKTGFATDLDVAQQRAQWATTEATIPLLESAERAGRHALAFLLGATPDALTSELEPTADLPRLPPEVPLGVPSDLLRRRPDIRAAERELAQATAQVGVATADLFPKFSLTGSFGFDSSEPKHLGDWSSHYYSIAPGIRWPILDWGRVRANIRLETERQQQAFLGYQKSVMQALKEVEDGLVLYEGEQTRRVALATAADASRHARELAQQRFAHGVADVLVTLETQRAVLAADDALAQSDAALRRDAITLYKALGGGWEQP